MRVWLVPKKAPPSTEDRLPDTGITVRTTDTTLICLIYDSDVEFGSSRPSEIWLLWCANFGNPENQISDLLVFEHP